jgi:hypothetical protein
MACGSGDSRPSAYGDHQTDSIVVTQTLRLGLLPPLIQLEGKFYVTFLDQRRVTHT